MNQLMAWWNSISQREQRLVAGGSIVLMLGALYWGIISPLEQRAENAKARINSEQQLLVWVKNSANSIVSLRGTTGASATPSTQPLNQVVSSSTARFKVELIRMQPRGDSLQVWIQPIPFNQLVNWLAYIQAQQGIDVEFLDLSRTETLGQVEVNRLQLKRVE